MHRKPFPVIDMVATGKNIIRLREERGLTVRDLQDYFGFEEPQAIYKWQHGKSLPTVDNLYALSALLEVPMEDILVPVSTKSNIIMLEQQEQTCCSNHFLAFPDIQATIGTEAYFDHYCLHIIRLRSFTVKRSRSYASHFFPKPVTPPDILTVFLFGKHVNILTLYGQALELTPFQKQHLFNSHQTRTPFLLLRIHSFALLYGTLTA